MCKGDLVQSRLAVYMCTLQIIPSHLANPKLPLDTSNCRQLASVGLWAKREAATVLCTELDCIGLKPSVRLSSETCERKK